MDQLDRPPLLAYTASQLLSINSVDHRPERVVRKAIFSHRLWRPAAVQAHASASPATSSTAGSKQSDVNKRCTGIRVGLLNTQSLAENRPIAVSDTILTRCLDVMVLTETWHLSNDDILLKRCAPPGYSVVGAARCDGGNSADKRGGGVAIVHSNRFAAKKITFDVKPTTFEVFGCSLRSASVTVAYIVIYRPGTKPAPDEFFRELTELLEIVVTFRNEIVITGDFNIHVNDVADGRASRLAGLLESFGLLQSVSQPTHRKGNTLDLVITRPTSRPTTCTVDPPNIISDHALVVCGFQAVLFAARQIYRSVRPWKKLDRAEFRRSLKASELCVSVEEMRSKSADELFDIYDNTLRRLADYYAPASNRPCRMRRLSPWFDNDCRCSRRRSRLLERRYRRTKTDVDRAAWVVQVRTMHSLYQEKENLYWNTCIASNTGNPRKMWRSVFSHLEKGQRYIHSYVTHCGQAVTVF